MKKIIIFILIQWILFIENQIDSYYDDSYLESILLEDIKELTLVKGKYTTGRRSDPILQLKCFGNACNTKYEPNIVHCTNIGIDNTGNIQWECKSELDRLVTFGEIVVSCEGYSHSTDKYILKGSCGLEYNLNFIQNNNLPKKWVYLIIFFLVVLPAIMIILNFVIGKHSNGSSSITFSKRSSFGSSKRISISRGSTKLR